MRTIAEAFTEIVRLIGDTFRLWLKNLVPMLGWFFAGYAAFRLATAGAIWLTVHHHDKIAIGLFSFGVLAEIAAVGGAREQALVRGTAVLALHRPVLGLREGLVQGDQDPDPGRPGVRLGCVRRDDVAAVQGRRGRAADLARGD